MSLSHWSMWGTQRTRDLPRSEHSIEPSERQCGAHAERRFSRATFGVFGREIFGASSGAKVSLRGMMGAKRRTYNESMLCVVSSIHIARAMWDWERKYGS